MNDLEKYDEIMLLLDESLKEIDNDNLEEADIYLEQAASYMKDLGIYE